MKRSKAEELLDRIRQELVYQPAPAGCKRQALEQGSGTVLVCKAGVL